MIGRPVAMCLALGAGLLVNGETRLSAIEEKPAKRLPGPLASRAFHRKIAAFAPGSRAGWELEKLSSQGKAGFGVPRLLEKKGGGVKVLRDLIAPGPHAKLVAHSKTVAAAGGGAGIAGTPCATCPVAPIDCGGTAPGSLGAGDCALGDGSLIDVYRLVLPGPRVVTISHVSPEFDAFLFLVNDVCDVVATNDDCTLQDLSSCLTLTLAAGTYFIVANSFAAGDTGAYTLRVTCEEVRACGDCLTGNIGCGETRSGALASGDCSLAEGQRVDYYRFDLAQAGPVTIELRSIPLDPVLHLFDSLCGELGLNDDCVPNDLDRSCLTADLPAGTYYIGASSLTAGETGEYEVEITCPDASACRDCEVGTAPCGGTVSGVLEAGDCALAGFPADVWRLDLAIPAVLGISLTSGANLAVDLLDLSCQVVASNDECAQQGLESCLSLQQVAPGTYHVRVKGAEPGASGAYDLRVDCAPFNACLSCLDGAVACGGEVAGALEEGDCFLPDRTLYDAWSLHLDEQLRVSIDLTSPDFDTFLLIVDSACQLIAANDNCTGSNSCLIGTLPPGDYFIIANSAAPATGSYTLGVRCEQDPICEETCRAGTIACGGEASGELTPSDCSLDDGSFLDAYSLRLDKPERVTITLASTDFDAFLLLLSPATCNAIATNDDCDAGTNSCLTLDLTAGDYLVLANSFTAGSTGEYSLRVHCAPNPLCAECRAGNVPCNGAVSGTLPETGCRHLDGSFIDIYHLDLLADGQVDIELTGNFDTFLFLADSECNILATNDDCQEGNVGRSCISLGLTAGAYAVWVNSLSAGETGGYTLEVSSPDCAPCESCRVGEVSCDAPVDATIPSSGCRLPGERSLELWELTLEEPEELTIRIESAEFDPSLTLYDASCGVIASNDDCDMSTLDACLTIELEPGTYSVGVNNFLPDESGAYRLSVSCGGGGGQSNGNSQFTRIVNAGGRSTAAVVAESSNQQS
jgi:hypothetical protein